MRITDRPRALGPPACSVLAAALLIALSGVPVRSASAQEGSVSGTVSESKTGWPLAEAVVRVEGTRLAARTDGRGQFRIAGVSGDVRLQVTRLGFLPRTVRTTAGDSTVRISLDQKLIELEALVVTGTAGATEVRALGSAIGKVEVAEVVKVAPPTKLQDMLSVSIPGVRIMRAGGQVGTGGMMRIRGAGSLSLSNTPLVYVDGVRTDNSNADLAVAFSNFDEPSRINDLDPEEIESVEVIKGPAAAALYGTEAANGVIQIITKRGKVGKPTFEVRASAGVNWLPDSFHRWDQTWFVNNDSILQRFNVLQYNRDQGFPDVFHAGAPIGGGASVSGGTDAVRYFVSAALNRDEGIVSYNWQNKFNARGNLSVSRGPLQIDASYGLLRSRLRTASPDFAVTTGIAFACANNSCLDLPFDYKASTKYQHGWPFARPEDYQNSAFGYDNEDRNVAGIKVTHQPFSWLIHRLHVGADIGTNLSERLIYKDTSDTRRPFGDASDGFKAVSNQRVTYYTVDYGATASFSPFGGLSTQSSGGAQYYEKVTQNVVASGLHFAIPGPGDITGASLREATEDYIPNKTVGVYLQQEVAWKNRVFFTAAMRGDDNSAFGKNFDFITYPKLSASWVLSDEPFFARRVPLLETLKLRAAWGHAGQQPDAFAALRQYQSVVGYQGRATLTPADIGNPDLKPEVGSEVELGFDAALRNQRLSLELTWYDKKVNDAILSVPLRPSSGFPGVKFINAGQTENSGIEIGVSATPLQRRNVSWSVRGTFATNNATVNRLLPGVTNMYVGGLLSRQFNVVGYAPFSYFYKRVVNSNILSEPDPSKWEVSCEGGAAYTRGNGRVVPCGEANPLYYGRPTPQWSGSVSSDLTVFHNFRLFALVDMLGGNTMATGELSGPHEIFFTSKASAASLQVLSGTRKFPVATDPRLAGILYLSADADIRSSSGVIRNGFAKLRTVSGTYYFPDALARRAGASRGSLTVAAENLATLWREQSGTFGLKFVDPEITWINGPTGLSQYQQDGWPQSTRVSFTLRLTY